MSQIQYAFDFDSDASKGAEKCVTPAPRKKAKRIASEVAEHARLEVYWVKRRAEQLEEAREYWAVGMVTDLPLWSKVPETGKGITYTQMLPGVVESIDNDLATVRIYASPEYGYWLEDYPLHRKLAVGVPLVELGKYCRNIELVRIAVEGRLETGDPELAVHMRARQSFRRAA
jgi:hypothetical protein